MEKNLVIITVRGGLVESVHSNNQEIKVEIIDWDNINAGDEPCDEDVKIIEDVKSGKIYHQIY